MGPDGKPLELVPVETTGKDAWAGVAAVDKGEEPDDFGRIALLAGGDLAALILFAAIGRANHGEGVNADTFATALPFIVAWFSTAPFLGGYGTEAQRGTMQQAAIAAAKCWAVATPFALALRGMTKGYMPPTPFIIVSLVATAVLLVGWRTGLAATNKQEPEPAGAAAKAAARKDRKGNPLEFLQLLMSLTTRW